jgi:kexin
LNNFLGIDYEHNDIKDNFYAESSYDFNDLRKLPMPMLKEDTHGTRCAGQIAGVKNDACGIGIAHEAKVAGKLIHYISYKLC